MTNLIKTLLLFAAVAAVIAAVVVVSSGRSRPDSADAAPGSALAVTASPIMAPPVPASAIHPSGKYLGVATPAAQVAGFAAATGAQPAILAQYVQVGQPFTAPPAGYMPYVNLETSVPASVILHGSDDTDLRSFARSVAAYGKPVIISIDPEMNGPWYSYGTKKASHGQFVALYRHVHDVIERAGARNVIWVWAVSNSAPITHTSLLAQLYPGDSYVDWIGVDGYYVGWDLRFTQIFTRVFNRIRAFTKRPFIISETSVQPGPYAASCVQDLFTGVKTSPDVLGFVWFNYNKQALGRQDWRLQDDPGALAAFRQAAKNWPAAASLPTVTFNLSHSTHSRRKPASRR